MRKPAVQNLIAYTIAGIIVCYAARGVSWTNVVDATGQASLWMFVLASLSGFLCCFFGEAVLYSRLFSDFHGPTGTIELLPTMAAVYFLQIVNSWVAGGAFALFLHTRKRAPWLMAGCTLMFQAYLDATLLATMALLAIVLVPTSPLRLGLEYAVGILGVSCLIASYFLLWGARLSARNWLRFIYDLPSMASFRMARPRHYLELFGIRSLIIVGVGFALYGQFVSFHIQISLIQVLAITPLIAAIGNSAISPGGIGTTQLIFTFAFAHFASRNNLFALSLAITVFNFLVRLPMGIAMRTPVAEGTDAVPDEYTPEYRVN